MTLCSWRIFYYCHLRQCRSGQFTENPTLQASQRITSRLTFTRIAILRHSTKDDRSLGEFLTSLALPQRLPGESFNSVPFRQRSELTDSDVQWRSAAARSRRASLR
jgi:hypothetical protein